VSISFVDKQAGRHNAIEAAYWIVTNPRSRSCRVSNAIFHPPIGPTSATSITPTPQDRMAVAPVLGSDEHIYGGIMDDRSDTLVW